MFARIFRSKEVRWTRAALEELLDRNPKLQHVDILERVKRRLDPTWCLEGFKRGLSANQIAAVAVLQSAEEALVFGSGNFVYRGMLTRKGAELVAAHSQAAQLLFDSHLFDQSKLDEVRMSLQLEIEALG
ncbi:MAG: hypothetical protein JXR75_12325 [Rhodobacteraceae bacterium]|nr:hypothetical protein [Paracoccaceae bacterium]